MNKKALLALSIATLLPLTVWYKVKNIQLTNQLNQQVSLDDLNGRIIVVSFFFTRCPTICPKLGDAMRKLQNSFPKNDSIVQFISMTVDPKHDSVPQLRHWAEKHHVNPDNWWVVTGNRDSIYDFAFTEIKASVADVNVDTAFVHTENFFLLDKNRVIRGWYNGLDSTAQSRLVRDIPLLMLEKNKKKSFKDFFNQLKTAFDFFEKNWILMLDLILITLPLRMRSLMHAFRFF